MFVLEKFDRRDGRTEKRNVVRRLSFVTAKELSELGLDHLIGTKMLERTCTGISWTMIIWQAKSFLIHSRTRIIRTKRLRNDGKRETDADCTEEET